MARSLDALQEGTNLAGYVVGRVLGRGGFGITYFGTKYLFPEAKVAIKEFLPRGHAMRTPGAETVHATDPDEFREALASLEAEAWTLKELHHPNVAEVQDFLRANGTAYLVMKYEEGKSLAQLLERDGTLSEAEIFEILPPLLDGIEAVHEKGYLHRDVKPGNIYLRSADGSPVLLDFGAARKAMGDARVTRLTQVLTPGYAPPEQYLDTATQGPFTDLYALGATLYRCMTGGAPPESLMRAHARQREAADPLTPIERAVPGRYSIPLMDAVRHSLEIDERKRPQSVGDLRILLGIEATRAGVTAATDAGVVRAGSRAGQRLAEHPASRPTPLARDRSRRRAGLRWALAVSLVVAAGGAVGLYVYLDRKSGRVFRDCPDCPEMVVIPGGTFTMGSPDWEEGRSSEEGPQHSVTVGQFALGKYEVTRGEFAVFVRETGHAANGCSTYELKQWFHNSSADWSRPGFAQTDRHPVVCVNWHDAKAYAEWLSRKTGKTYRLPSEAEWEYAARAGTTTRTYWGDDPGYREACRYANGADQRAKKLDPKLMTAPAPCDDGHDYTAPVGSYEANRFGLHDMSGNVSEWVEDCWHGGYDGAPRDGSAWTTGDCTSRMQRGGSWKDLQTHLRSADRASDNSTNRGSYVGFRLARSL